MARSLNFQAILHFSLSSHAELTSMRASAAAFAATHGGKFDLFTNEDSDNVQLPYYAKLVLEIPVSSRANAASAMGLIDSALSGLPELAAVSGVKLRYTFVEREV